MRGFLHPRIITSLHADVFTFRNSLSKKKPHRVILGGGGVLALHEIGNSHSAGNLGLSKCQNFPSRDIIGAKEIFKSFLPEFEISSECSDTRWMSVTPSMSKGPPAELH